MKNKFIFLLVCFSLAASNLFNLHAQVPDTPPEDFKIKGFHLDLRLQVMTPKALKEFAKQISEMGMNTIIMEWEGTYPFKEHAILASKYAYSREQVKEFISYCDSLGIQVIPLQQSLGHVEYILRHNRYSALKVDRKDISQLNPLKVSKSRKLFKELFSDLAKMHNSEYIHIGGDETRLLELCEGCKEKIERKGLSELYVDYMKEIAEIVIDLGKTPIMWADMILQHPEAAEELPEELILVDWNYGWPNDYFGDIDKLQELGFTFWGAPAIRCYPDSWFMTNWNKHFNNQKEFIPYAREEKYEGMIMTSWSTSGVYGFTWGQGYDVLAVHPLRYVYPMSGFRILIASYSKALKSEKPINPEKFILEYGKNRFGLSDTDAEKLVEFLLFPRELIINGTPLISRSVEKTKKHFAKVRELIYQIEPAKHKKEFAHFKLMADLRMHYLDIKEVEAQYNSKKFTTSQAAGLLKRLDSILKDAETLSKRFYNLNKGFIYDDEIKEQNEIRIKGVKVLYARLERLKQISSSKNNQKNNPGK